MNILFVEADLPHELSTSIWLCRIPAAAINRTGKHRAQVVFRDEFVAGRVDIDWPSVIVVERLLAGRMLDVIRDAQKRGKRVIARFDDAYHLMPSYIASSNLWRRSLLIGRTAGGKAQRAKLNVSMIKQFREGLALCDATSTPSRLLCKDYERFAKKMFFVPNYPDLGNRAWLVPKKKHDGIIIGWGGGGTHKQSWRDSRIIPALESLCREYPQLKIMICGIDQWVVEELTDRLPAGQLITQAWVPSDKWPEVLSEFDIGIAPLAGRYDDRRSWIKVLDYAIKGIPWVATNAPPYTYCQGGIRVKNKPKNWKRALRTLIEKESTRKKLISVGTNWAWRQGIHSHISTYLNFFDEVMKG